ncbi:MAG TPA: TRAP transporter small permease [Psychromonas sp.]
MIEQLLKGYCRFVRYSVKLVGRAVPVLLPILAGLVAFEVFARYILGSPTIWVYDTSLFLFGYISALGGAYAQQKKSHINVDIIYLMVPKYVRSIFNLLTIVLAVGFLILLAKMSFEKFSESLQLNYRTQSEWAPEVYHFWLMMTVSAVIFIAEYSAEFIENIFYLFTRRALFSKEELAADAAKKPLLSLLRSFHLTGLSAFLNDFFLRSQSRGEPNDGLDYEEVIDKHQEEIALEHAEKSAKRQKKIELEDAEKLAIHQEKRGSDYAN